MDVLEKLLLLIATMTLGVLEIALEPLAADKEPTSDAERPIKTAVPATMTTRAAEAKLSGR
jgi:hypothetical protein